jgi:hypothetical protein
LFTFTDIGASADGRLTPLAFDFIAYVSPATGLSIRMR